jgi:hypothetical protein
MKVRLLADPDTGQLIDLQFNSRSLGGGDRAFEILNDEIRKSVNALQAAGPENIEKQEVEIDPDFDLDYRYVIAAMSSVSGTRLPNGNVVPLFKKVKFAPIREAR